MEKSPQFNIEETFCEYLSKYYRGSNNPVSSKTLEAVFHVKGSEIRRIVNSLRSKGEPICSDYDGYFYADNQHENQCNDCPADKPHPEDCESKGWLGESHRQR